jgi:hypothetical protein
MTEWRSARSDFLALSEKYRELAALRRARSGGEKPAPRDALRRLAARFPGALNELDTMELGEIEARAVSLDRAAAGGAIEPWMQWIHLYHRLLRVALGIRRSAARPRGRSELDAAALASRAVDRAGVPVDDAFVRSVLEPPDGRVVNVVLHEVARRTGTGVADVESAILPRRRPRA